MFNFVSGVQKDRLLAEKTRQTSESFPNSIRF